MHRVATQSGDLDLERKLEAVRQTPAEILFVSTADTELSALARVWGPKFGGRLRLMSAGALQHPAAAEYYADHVLMHSKLAIFRLHGGRGYFPHLLDEIQHIKSHGAQVRVLVLPGTDQWDAELLSYSDYAEPLALRLFDYFREGGLANYELAAQAVERLLDNQSDGFPEPITVPTFGWYEPWKQTTA